MNTQNSAIQKDGILHKGGVSFVLPFVMVTSCFALWGMLNSMNDQLVPAFAKIFMINAVNSSLAQVAFYTAYAVLAIPAAMLIKRYSYKVGVLVGLGFYIIGALGYIPAALNQSYHLFICSIFVLACGLSVLETTCNPFVLSLGSEDTSIRRLNFAQAFNPVGSLSGIFVAKYVILAHLDATPTAERLKWSAEQLATTRHHELTWVCTPYMILIVVALILWFLFFKSHIPDARANEPKLNFKESVSKLFSIPRYYWGVMTQFIYVGLQTCVWTWTVKYAMELFKVREAEGAVFFLYSMVLFIGFRWICTALIKVVNPAMLLSIFAVVGGVVTLGVIYMPASVSIWCLVCLSGCMSLMFPTIYGIALRDMGDEIKLGAAGLIMAIIGGAVLTPLMGLCIDKGIFSALLPGEAVPEVAAVRTAFFIPLLCFIIIACYGAMNIRSQRAARRVMAD